MRNLKRALSLLLAAAMLIGMMVVGASAVSYNDFPDRDEIVNKDAVSMLTTLGIIEGTDQGTYNPTGDVDRAQMAKMISVALTNNENCDTLYQNVNSGLTDIAANWARGYINYCYTLGIIAGRGNNTFDPSANVTGVEAAKMLLTALGYDASIEGLVGNDWALNTAALAQNLGIFRNFTKDVSEPLNRDDAALLIYNALDVELIQEYRNGYAISYDDHRTILSSVFGVIRVEGVVVGNEWAQLEETDSNAALQAGRTRLDNVVWYDSTTANTVVDEGVRVTDPVTFRVSTPVEYMGKAVTMYVEKTTILSDSTVIGVATNDDMNVIHFTAEGQDTVSDYLQGTGVAVSDTETEYYVNYGHFDNEASAIDWVNEYYYSEDQTNDFSLNGIEVQVIDNDDDGTAEYVLYLQETLSEVARYNERNETVAFYTPDRTGTNQVNLKVPSTSDDAVTTVTEDLADVVTAESVSLDGVVTSDSVDLATEALILYVQYGGRTYITNPDIVTGTMTRIDRDRDNELYITIDGGTDPYYQSYILDAASMVDVDVTRFFIDDPDVEDDAPGFDISYDFILDSNGYIVAFRPAEEVVTNYALVLDSAWTQNALTRGGEIKILRADGVEQTYDLNWNASADAFDKITYILDKSFNVTTGTGSDTKLEYYLGSRDVVQDKDEDDINTDAPTYKTGRAAGSVITYSLNEAGDQLTIESVLQENVFEDDTTNNLDESLEIDANTNVTTTAGVSDSGRIVFLDGDPDNHDNLQYVATNGYDNGHGTIEVEASYRYPARTQHKDYAVDQNTVGFYYYWDDAEDEYVYGVATGWENLSDVDPDTDVQVYPVLDKTTNRTYKASNLAGLILFEAEPNTVAANYMLVLSRNAVSKDVLELNVVFEDGTAATIEIDDEGDEFNRNVDDSYMKAYTYSENADGTYDIGTMANRNGTADLLRVGTIALNEYDYLSLPSSANVWDVTEVERGDDDVPTGRFQENVYVNAVVIVSEGQVRTAWIWDLEDDQTPTGGFNFNWDTTGFETIYWFDNDYSQWQLQQYLMDGTSVRVIGDAELGNDLVIPTGTVVQFENDLNDRGYSITGGGALRVRDTYYNHSGSISVSTQVGDTVNDDLVLGDLTTTISSRMGVYGDINGYGVNPCTLTIDSASSVYVTGDVDDVEYLHVDGHLQANNVIIHNGVVHSERTLVVLGDITLYSIGTPANAGSLTIGGTCGTTNTTGRVELYGTLKGDGNLTVTSGVLNLARTANITLANGTAVGGTVTVNATTGSITQLAGTRHTMTMDQLNVNGTMNVPSCTIDCPAINVGSTGSLTAAGATSTPTVEQGGKTNIGTDTGTEEPVASDLRISSMTVKDVPVSLNHSTRTGTVELGYTEGESIAQNNVVVTPSDTNNVTVTINVVSNSSITVELERTTGTGNETTVTTVTYAITVTRAAASNNTNVGSIYVKGQQAQLDPNHARTYTVSLTNEQASNSTYARVVVNPDDANAQVENATVTSGRLGLGQWTNTSALTNIENGGNGSFTFTITAEDGETESETYTVNVSVAAPAAVPANVTLTATADVVGTLTPGQNNSYELVLGRGNNMGAVTAEWVGTYITATGTGDLDSGTWAESSTSTDDTKVFTRTFNGANTTDATYSQTITLTVRLATVAEAAVQDMNIIRAAFPNGGHVSIGVSNGADAAAVASALKVQIENYNTPWDSDATATCSFNANNDWPADASGTLTRSMHIVVTATGQETYTADLTVSITVSGS